MSVYNVPGVGNLVGGQPFKLGGINYPANWLQLATEDELDALGITVEEVVAPEPEPPTEAELRAHADMRYSEQMDGGVFVGGVWVSTSINGRIDMTGAVSLAQLDPDHVFNWVNGATVLELTATQVIEIGKAVGLWVQANYTVLGQLRAEIDAGTITTFAEIDAAEWPPNS